MSRPSSNSGGGELQQRWFWQACADTAGTSLGIAAWGLVTGVAMVKSGMPVGLAVLMSLLVYAGSAQLAVIPLLTAGAPPWVVWLTAACVNLRFVLFSSLWRSYFAHLPLRQRLLLSYFSGDVVYVTFMQRFPQARPQPGQQPYFWGAASTVWLAWQSTSLAGILLANAVPLHWGLGFAGVLALLGVLLSLLIDRATWLAMGFAASAALAAFALPLKLNILVALAAAGAAGCLMEAADRRRQPPPPPAADAHAPPEREPRTAGQTAPPHAERRHDGTQTTSRMADKATPPHGERQP